MSVMSTEATTSTLADLHWAKGDDGDLIAEAHDHELVVYPPTATGRAFWFITTPTDTEVASGFADTTADAKDAAAYAVHQNLRLWDL
jgi:hypothetical protein